MFNILYYGKNMKIFKEVSDIISKNTKEQCNIHISDSIERASLFLIEPECTIAGINGIDFALKIRNSQAYADIIFVSSDYLSLVDILHKYIKPTGYFVSPISKSEFENIFNRIVEHTVKPEKQIEITHDYKRCEISVNSIVYFMEENKKVVSVMEDGSRISFYKTLSDLEISLRDDFIRCHSGFLINRGKILSINYPKMYVRMKNKEEVPISRKYKPLMITYQ